MASAGYSTRTRAPLKALTYFYDTFERATELGLHGLFAVVAGAFADHAADLDHAVVRHDAVLVEIANSIGLDLAAPLEHPHQEARAQRETWMTPATWAVQALMGSLPRASGERLTEEDWVGHALDGTDRPRRPNAIDESDEASALAIAARALLSSNLNAGRSLFLGEQSLLVQVNGDGVLATKIDPTVLISQHKSGQEPPPSLAAGDELWLADEGAQHPMVSGTYRQELASSFVMTSPGGLSVGDGEAMAAVVDGVWCYFKGT